MDGYEKLIATIRTEGGRNNPPVLTLGEMLSEKECRTGNQTLDADDLLVAEHLTKRVLSGLNIKADDSGCVASGTDDQCEYLEPLKKGDQVLLYPVSDEKYVIIEKVVSV